LPLRCQPTSGAPQGGVAEPPNSDGKPDRDMPLGKSSLGIIS
jgi:hypothetical protein